MCINLFEDMSILKMLLGNTILDLLNNLILDLLCISVKKCLNLTDHLLGLCNVVLLTRSVSYLQT